MQLYFLIAFGGALGSALRFFLSGAVANHFGETFPWGTLIINVTGSFVIGFFAAFTASMASAAVDSDSAAKMPPV